MIHLERLTWDNYDDVLKLKVAKEQKEYIVPNSDSLIHAFFAMTENKAQIFPFGIYLGKTPVGFMMIARDVPWIEQYYGSPAKYYYIWRFMIDKRYQGNGYGKEAMLQALDFIRTVPLRVKQNTAGCPTNLKIQWHRNCMHLWVLRKGLNYMKSSLRCLLY